VQFLIGHFSSQHDTPSDILAACVAFHIFFSFLEIFPLLFTKYFFLSLYSFQWHWDNQIWDEIFSLLWLVPL